MQTLGRGGITAVTTVIVSVLAGEAAALPGDRQVFMGVRQQGVGGVDGLNYPGAVAVSPDGAHVYVTALGLPASGPFLGSTLSVFARDPFGGGLSLVDVLTGTVQGESLYQAAGLAFSPDGAHLYVAVDGASSLLVLGRNAGTGALTLIESQVDGVGGVDGLSVARDVEVSSDGSHVYVASIGDDAVAAFARNPTTGAVTFVEAERDGVGGVDGLAGREQSRAARTGSTCTWRVSPTVPSPCSAETREPAL